MEYEHRRIDEDLYEIFNRCNDKNDKVGTKKRFSALHRLLLAVERTKMYDKNRVGNHSVPKNSGHNNFYFALSEIAHYHKKWIREPEDWVARSHNPIRQFSSLTRHLFAKYEVPLFFDSAWFQTNPSQQQWFIFVAQGGNIRKASDLPFPLTKKMAHYMMQAPNDYTVDDALRWGQIHGLGGNERLVKAILGSRIGRFSHGQVNGEFWQSVIHFFVNNSMMDMNQLGPIVDYIHAQKFQPQEPVIVDGFARQLGPPQPNFSMKGRTVESLLRQTEAWHKQINRRTRRGRTLNHYSWDLCGIDGFYKVEGKAPKQRIFTISELFNTKQLLEEGRAMGHCVGSYGHSCKTGRCAIFSMTRDIGAGIERLLTIEVSPHTRQIKEARMKRNDPPNQECRKILEQWARKEDLSFCRWVF